MDKTLKLLAKHLDALIEGSEEGPSRITPQIVIPNQLEVNMLFGWSHLAYVSWRTMERYVTSLKHKHEVVNAIETQVTKQPRHAEKDIVFGEVKSEVLTILIQTTSF